VKNKRSKLITAKPKKNPIKQLKLIAMVGVPGSGKSTWAKNYCKKHPSVIRVATDEIRSDIFGHQYHEPAEIFVWAVAESMGRLLLSNGHSILVDATNITKTLQLKWIRMASNHGAEVSFVIIDTPLKTCLVNNRKRPKNQQVPHMAIEAFYMEFEKSVPDLVQEFNATRIKYKEVE